MVDKLLVRFMDGFHLTVLCAMQRCNAVLSLSHLRVDAGLRLEVIVFSLQLHRVLAPGFGPLDASFLCLSLQHPYTCATCKVCTSFNIDAGGGSRNIDGSRRVREAAAWSPISQFRGMDRGRSGADCFGR